MIDIMPTILDFMKMTEPDRLQGVSLRNHIFGHRADNLDCYIETLYPMENFGWSPLEGVVWGKWKFIKAPIPELYDLENDKFEEINLFSARDDVSKRVMGFFESYKKEITLIRPEKSKPLSEEVEERLRSLGYLGGNHKGKYDGPLPDPKEKIDDYILYFQANLSETRGDYRRAAEIYRKLLELNPEAPWNYINLGLVYMKMNKPAEAVELLEKAREEFPDSQLILSRPMSFYLAVNRWTEALRTGKELLDRFPESFDALYLMGGTLARLGRWQEALPFFEKAMQIEPENKMLRRRYGYSLMATGNLKKAEEIYLSLKNDGFLDLAVALELVELYEYSERRDEAHEVIREFIEANPDLENNLRHALNFYLQERKTEAILYLNQYLSLVKENDPQQMEVIKRLLDKWRREQKLHQR